MEQTSLWFPEPAVERPTTAPIVESPAEATPAASALIAAPAADAEIITPAPTADPHIFTVTELTQQIKGLLEGAFPEIWVSGEVTSFRPASSGHWYFQLKDEQSVINLVVFRGVNQHFKFRMEDGLELICRGKIDCFPKRGTYQLIVTTLEPKGKGALQLAFEQLKQRLAQEGLFDPAHKVALPFLPRRIGVVTSPTGAAIRDILQILRRRCPGIDVLIAPAKVQGEGAATEIAAAIQWLDTQGGCDVLIVGRGGGSIEDLWAFNEEPVARALFACRTPVISAVGHEIDFTIADFVADVRAPTPSAAAEIVAPASAELLNTVRERRRQLQLGLRRWWQLRAQRVADLRTCLRPPTARFAHLLLQIDHCREGLIHRMQRGLREGQGRLQQLQGELQHLSPLAVLKKGYAVVQRTDTGVALRRAAECKPQQAITIRFADGNVGAAVTQVEPTTTQESV